MTTIISGSNGFSAYFLAEYIKTNYNDTIIGIDLQPNNDNDYIDSYYSTADYLNFNKILEGLNDEVRFFHLGGLIGMLPLSELISANVFWTSKYLEAIKNVKKIKIFVNIGSSSEYGLQTEQVLNEALITHPVTNYGMSKDIQSKLVLHFGRIFNLPVVSTRTFNLIGPGLSDKLVAGKIVKEINSVKSGKKNFIEIGRLDSKRDFIDIRDAVKIYCKIAENISVGEVINVARGKSYEINEILNTSKSMANVNPEIKSIYKTNKKQDLDYQFADISKMKSVIGKIEFIPFEKTIEDMLYA